MFGRAAGQRRHDLVFYSGKGGMTAAFTRGDKLGHSFFFKMHTPLARTGRGGDSHLFSSCQEATVFSQYYQALPTNERTYYVLIRPGRNCALSFGLEWLSASEDTSAEARLSALREQTRLGLQKLGPAPRMEVLCLRQARRRWCLEEFVPRHVSGVAIDTTITTFTHIWQVYCSPSAKGSCAECYRYFTQQVQCTCPKFRPAAAAQAAVHSMRDRLFADDWDEAIALGWENDCEYWDPEYRETWLEEFDNIDDDKIPRETRSGFSLDQGGTWERRRSHLHTDEATDQAGACRAQCVTSHLTGNFVLLISCIRSTLHMTTNEPV
eukprot:g14178.t1